MPPPAQAYPPPQGTGEPDKPSPSWKGLSVQRNQLILTYNVDTVFPGNTIVSLSDEITHVVQSPNAQYEAETTNQDAMVMVRIYRWANIVTHKNVDLLNSDRIPHSALVDPTTRKQNQRSWDMGEIAMFKPVGDDNYRTNPYPGRGVPGAKSYTVKNGLRGVVLQRLTNTGRQTASSNSNNWFY